MQFIERLQSRNTPTVLPIVTPSANPYNPMQPHVEGSAPSSPPALVNIADTVDRYLPAIEQITGLTRREIFLHLLKTGVKGGSVEGLISGLIGQQRAEPDAKFVRYVKTLAIWIPAGLFLVGLVLITLVLYAKFMISIVGGL